MTPAILQKSLVEEIRNALKDIRLKNKKNEETDINIYMQYLPEGDEEKAFHFPYALVKFVDGEDTEENSKCKIEIILGVYDKSLDFQGYQDVMNLIQRIRKRLESIEIIGGSFKLIKPLRYAVYEENVQPYFFGGIETNWIIPGVEREINF